MKQTLFYCYDAYCGWCYGFSPVMKKIQENFLDKLEIEVLSGGMLIGEQVKPISRIAPYIRSAYTRVEDLTGIKFGNDFLWHINHPEESDWQMNSEKPAIALCIFKDFYPARQLEFASDLQYALNYEGRDLDDNEAYRHLLEKYSVQPEIFYQKLGSEEYKEQAYFEFGLCKQLKVSGFPAVLLQLNESKFYLLARGFTPFEELGERINNLLIE
ncbi:MAG: DsbA family protein [Ferruginibacter sp.]